MKSDAYHAEQDRLWAVVRGHEARAKSLRAAGDHAGADAACDEAEQAYFDAIAFRQERSGVTYVDGVSR